MIYGGGQPSNECEAYLLRMLCVEILDALRDAERELTGGSDQRLLYRVLQQRSDTRYADLKERLLDLEEAIRSNAALSGIKDDVAKLLKRVSLMTAGEDHDSLQLLLTSHSTHIAAKLRLENTAVLFRDDQTGKIASHHVLDGIDPVKERDSIRFLSLYLDATKSGMFFARRLILVEGIAEQTVIPVLFEQFAAKTLESIGCSVLNVNGVAFRHFLMVVRNGFFKRCVVLTDQDTGTKAENRADALKLEFEDGNLVQVHVTDTSTFEKDVIAANRSGLGKELLFDALTATKPVNGPKLRLETGGGAIDVEKFFGEIKSYKAEFAFNLVELLRQRAGQLMVPAYIENAFTFIAGR